jgi:hypothetical protein
MACFKVNLSESTVRHWNEIEQQTHVASSEQTEIENAARCKESAALSNLHLMAMTLY